MTEFLPKLQSHSRAASMPRWHKWLVIFAVLWTVTLYTGAATHHHRTLAQDLDCPICHVAGHDAINLFEPGAHTSRRLGHRRRCTAIRGRGEGFYRVDERFLISV